MIWQYESWFRFELRFRPFWAKFGFGFGSRDKESESGFGCKRKKFGLRFGLEFGFNISDSYHIPANFCFTAFRAFYGQLDLNPDSDLNQLDSHSVIDLDSIGCRFWVTGYRFEFEFEMSRFAHLWLSVHINQCLIVSLIVMIQHPMNSSMGTQRRTFP